MNGKSLKSLCFMACVFLLGVSGASAFTLTFEDGTDQAAVTGIDGVSFKNVNGHDAIYGDSRTGEYNTYSEDLDIQWGEGSFHHYGYLYLWAGADTNASGVIVDFTDDNGTWLTTGYSSYGAFEMTAYLTDGSQVSVSGETNTFSSMDFLTVNASNDAFIDYVFLSGEYGNTWLVDNMSGDATGVGDSSAIPEPGTIILLGLGLLGLVGIGRKQRPAKSWRSCSNRRKATARF